MRFSEKWGDSIDNAVELALADLKLTREDVVITVLEEPSKGFFGIGSKLAKVRVEEKAKEKPVKPAVTKSQDKKPEKPVAVEKKEKEADEKPVRQEKKVSKKERKPKREKTEILKEEKQDYSFGEINILGERPDDLVEQEEHPAKAFLVEITKEMGLDVSVKVFTNTDSVYVDIEGPDSGTVIGKRGQTLDAIQYLTSLAVNKDDEKYSRVVIDAEGYRQKREIALEKLAVRLAEKAKRSGKNVRLEPMNPYERKVIHTALQKVSGVTTRSEGEEPYRRVVIEPARK